MVNFCFDFNSNHMTLATDFSSICWLIAFNCVNISDLDVSQSMHVDKMEKLSKEFTEGYNGQSEKLVLCARVWNLSPYEMICSVADEMLAKGTIGDALWRFTHLCAFL